MSCSGCRVLRKGCGENCMLRQCLKLIQSPQAQGFATLFVAKFFGRAGLLSFVSAVPEHQRPALFQSLLFEAVGRTINPVGGAVGLLWTGNWHLCQSAVETVLHGCALQVLPQFTNGFNNSPDLDSTSESEVDYLSNPQKRKRSKDNVSNHVRSELNLSLKSPAPQRRVDTQSDGSETTTSGSGSSSYSRFEGGERESKLLRLFI